MYQLLLLQALAAEPDRLAELQPQAAGHVAAALAAATAAAELGLVPALQLAAERLSAATAAAGCDASLLPSLWQLCSQVGCYAGPPEQLLPVVVTAPDSNCPWPF